MTSFAIVSALLTRRLMTTQRPLHPAYDPRPFPEAIVGQNCIVPEYRGKGFGRLQLRHLLAMLKSKGFEKATVTTTDNPFFEPAQRMYQACGFAEVKRRHEGHQRLIEYSIQLR